MWRRVGDGAGCLVAIPADFFARVVREDCGVRLPPPEEYAIAQLFLPRAPDEYHVCKGIVAKCAPLGASCPACLVGLRRVAPVSAPVRYASSAHLAMHACFIDRRERGRGCPTGFI